MAEKKNLCAQIPTALHEQVCEAREAAGLTTAQYITNLLTEYYEMKKNGGNEIMANTNTRTMAFQVGEDLFQRIKAHLERETIRTGKKLTQGLDVSSQGGEEPCGTAEDLTGSEDQ